MLDYSVKPASNSYLIEFYEQLIQVWAGSQDYTNVESSKTAIRYLLRRFRRWLIDEKIE